MATLTQNRADEAKPISLTKPVAGVRRPIATRADSFLIVAKEMQARFGAMLGNKRFQTCTAASTGAGFTLAMVGAPVGALGGGMIGGAGGILFVPFSFGLSVPIGGTMGTVVGGAAGAALGGGAGVVGGGITGSVAYAYRVQIKKGLVYMTASVSDSVRPLRGGIKIGGAKNQNTAGLALAGGCVGGLGGVVVGGAIGIVPALFTFGLSIPIGAVLGGGTGFCIGGLGGGTVGSVVNSRQRKKEQPEEGARTPSSQKPTGAGRGMIPDSPSNTSVLSPGGTRSTQRRPSTGGGRGIEPDSASNRSVLSPGGTRRQGKGISKQTIVQNEGKTN